jgi:phospholipase/lecithinase/hemolysin
MRIPNFLRAAFTLFVIVVLAACSEDQVTHKKDAVFTPSALIVFGDSYSDNGNTYRSSHSTYPFSPAYWEGRFSNGPVWVEYLARHFGLDPYKFTQLSDFAYGQAQAKGRVTLTTQVDGQPSLFTIPDLAGEYQLFVASNPPLNSNALYIVFIGANDFCNHFTPDANAQQLISDVLNAQKNLVRRLQENYHAAHFVVVNARDLSAAPIAMSLAHAWIASHPKTTTKEYLD